MFQSNKRYEIDEDTYLQLKDGGQFPADQASPAASASPFSNWMHKDVFGEASANLVAAPFLWLVPRNGLTKDVIGLCSALLLLSLASLLWYAPGSLTAQGLAGDLNPLEITVCWLAVLLWHEIGHCAVARRLGLRVDSIGIGINYIFPVFYSRISLGFLLTPAEKIGMFLGGIYFQSLLSLMLLGAGIFFQMMSAFDLLRLNLMIMLFNIFPTMGLDGALVHRVCVDENWLSMRQARAIHFLGALSFIFVLFLYFLILKGFYNSTRNILIQLNLYNFISLLFYSFILFASFRGFFQIWRTKINDLHS